MYDEYFAKANELNRQGVPFATAVIVRAEKPTSAKPGDKAIVTLDGQMHGWIGGSCAQPTVIKEALQALAEDESRLIRLSTEPEQQTPRAGLVDMAMTCFSGGTLEIFIEPQRPLPHLMVVGNLPLARSLVQLGKAMNYRVTAVSLEGESPAGADEALHEVAAMRAAITPLSFVVVATHGEYDELVLTEALQAGAAYVGLVASQTRRASVEMYLRSSGVDEETIASLVCPAGLDIGAQRGDEIGLSIMAEIVQRRREMPELDVAAFFEKAGAETETAVSTSSRQVSPPREEMILPPPLGEGVIDLSVMIQQPMVVEEETKTAVDPICQMTVEISKAHYKSEYNGKPYYFCCGGCKVKFDAAPEQYV